MSDKRKRIRQRPINDDSQHVVTLLTKEIARMFNAKSELDVSQSYHKASHILSTLRVDAVSALQERLMSNVSNNIKENDK